MASPGSAEHNGPAYGVLNAYDALWAHEPSLSQLYLYYTDN